MILPSTKKLHHMKKYSLLAKRYYDPHDNWSFANSAYAYRDFLKQTPDNRAARRKAYELLRTLDDMHIRLRRTMLEPLEVYDEIYIW